MHVIASGTLVLVAGGIYRLLHTRAGGLIALILGTVAMGCVMMVANHYITPFYMMTPTEVVDAMLAQYNSKVKPLFSQYKTNLTEKEVLTVASIVEREAIFHDERPKIAAVYLNRLKIGKRLEADPTVQYALGFNFRENRYWKKGLTYRDLRNKSPYNTYRYNGLPPGPICNPSYESVKAVLNPEPDFDALYFVADNTGRHDFSRTYNEHLIKKNKYRRKK